MEGWWVGGVLGEARGVKGDMGLEYINQNLQEKFRISISLPSISNFKDSLYISSFTKARSVSVEGHLKSKKLSAQDVTPPRKPP